MPKSRIVIEDFRIDYELFSDTLPDEYFPKGANWLMLGPSGPRRLRLAVEHLAQYRGGICFCVDLDPRWVDQAHQEGLDGASRSLQGALHRPGDDHPRRRARHQVHVHDAQAARSRWPWSWKSGARSIRQAGITGIFSGGTEFTPQWTRFASEELLDGVYMTPTYGNTLMGLAAVEARDGRRRTTRSRYYAPQPRAVIEVVDFDDDNQVVELRRDGPREAHHADQGVLHPRLPGTRRRRARAAVTRSTPGTASAACGRSASWPQHTTVGVY